MVARHYTDQYYCAGSYEKSEEHGLQIVEERFRYLPVEVGGVGV